MNCPHCNSPLSSLEAAGSNCPVCHRAMEIAAEPIFDEPVRGRPSRRRKRSPAFWWIIGGCGVAGVALIGAVAYLVANMPNVTIYVDNGTNESLTVFVDGKEVETVPAQTARTVKLRDGEHHIRLTSSGKALLDETKQLQATRYVLDPQRKHRYWVRRIEYGENKFALNLRTLNDELADIDIREEEGQWYEVPQQVDWMMDDGVPEEIDIGQHQNTAVRHAFLRMDRKDYDLVRRYQKLGGNLNERQRKEVEECLERLLK